MRKRVDVFAAVMKQARRDKETPSNKQNVKETFAGQTEEQKEVVAPRKIARNVLGGGVFK